MLYLYLDESGDLGFDYERKKYEWFNIFMEKIKYDSLYLP